MEKWILIWDVIQLMRKPVTSETIRRWIKKKEHGIIGEKQHGGSRWWVRRDSIKKIIA